MNAQKLRKRIQNNRMISNNNVNMKNDCKINKIELIFI